MTHRLGFSGRGKVNKLNLAGQIVLRKQLARLCLPAGLLTLLANLQCTMFVSTIKAFVHLNTGYYGRKYCWTKTLQETCSLVIGKFYPIWEFICKNFRISVTLQMFGKVCKFLPRVEKGSTNISILYSQPSVKDYIHVMWVEFVNFDCTMSTTSRVSWLATFGYSFSGIAWGRRCS